MSSSRSTVFLLSCNSSWNCPIVVRCDALLPSRCPIAVPQCPIAVPQCPIAVPQCPIAVPQCPIAVPQCPIAVPQCPNVVPQCSNVIRICEPIRKQESVNVTCCKFLVITAIFEAAAKKMDGLWDKYYNFIV